MKKHRILSAMISIMFGASTLLFSGCIGLGDFDGFDPDDPNLSGNITPSEDSQFSRDVVVLTNGGTDTIVRDYAGRTMTFNDLIDREITTISTEIVKRLVSVYGQNNIITNSPKQTKLGEDVYTDWSNHSAVSDKYTVYSTQNSIEAPTISINGIGDEDVIFAFLYDSDGNMIPAEASDPYAEYVIDGSTGNYKIVYFVDSTHNNLDDYPNDFSAKMIVAKLSSMLEGSAPGITNWSAEYVDTYGSSSNVGDSSGVISSLAPFNMAYLSGAIAGSMYKYSAGQDSLSASVDANSAWEWNTYFGSNEAQNAINRLKYVIANIVSTNGAVDLSTINADDYSPESYNQLLSSIDFISNYTDADPDSGYFGDIIQEYILDYVIGRSLHASEASALTALETLQAKVREFETAIKYADDNYKSAIDDITETGNNNYRLTDLLDEINIYNNNSKILHGAGSRTLSDEFNYLVGKGTYSSESSRTLKFRASSFETDDYFYLYYGHYDSSGVQIDFQTYKDLLTQKQAEDPSATLTDDELPTPGYLDYSQGIKALGNLDFPYTLSDLVPTRNFRNYETVTASILQSIADEKFSSDCDPVKKGGVSVSDSVHMNTWRTRRDDNFTSLDDFEGTGEEVVYTDMMDFDAIIIPAQGGANITDMTHYELLIAFTNNLARTEAMGIRIGLQTRSSSGAVSEKVYLKRTDSGAIPGGDYFVSESDMIPDHDDIFKVLGHGRMQSTVDFYSTNMPNADSNTLDNTWSATFTLPSSLTEIVADEEQYDFDSGNEFHNDIEITSTIERDGTGRVTNRNVSYEIKADDCLIITFEVFDADGNMLQGQNKIPFGLSLSLVDSFVPSNEENN